MPSDGINLTIFILYLFQAQKPEQSVMQALESLNDNQVRITSRHVKSKKGNVGSNEADLYNMYAKRSKKIVYRSLFNCSFKKIVHIKICFIFSIMFLVGVCIAYNIPDEWFQMNRKCTIEMPGLTNKINLLRHFFIILQCLKFRLIFCKKYHIQTGFWQQDLRSSNLFYLKIRCWMYEKMYRYDWRMTIHVLAKRKKNV